MTLYLVIGPPASGKTTWVQQHANPGDIVIDYDAIANTLTHHGHGHKHTPTTKAVTKAARQAAIDTAVTVTDVDVYVIHAMPSPKLMQHYRALGAQVVTVDPGMDTVMARCKAGRPWQMQQAAKEWYATTQSQQTSQVSQQTSADMTRRW